jgi:hypothetical protein
MRRDEFFSDAQGLFLRRGDFFLDAHVVVFGKGGCFVGVQVIIGDRRNVGAQELAELINHVQRKIVLGKVYVQQTD